MANEATERDPRDIITPDAFVVAPELLGLPLAKPAKRLIAILVDLAAIGLLSLSGSLAFALAFGTFSYQLLSGTRAGGKRSKAVALLLALLIGGGVFWLGQQFDDEDSTGKKPAAEAAEVADLDDILEAAGEKDPALGATKIAIEALKTENQKLKKQNEHLQAQQEPSLLAWGEGLLDDIGFGFGWAAAYFTLLAAMWRGQTIGKALLGMRVLRLNGKPLTAWNSFERAGGYAAGFATGMLGFAQVWWDPNRQAIHDKICGTVVIDTRKGLPAPITPNESE